MSCHTWFYKKLDPQPTNEEMINSIIDEYTNLCNIYSSVLDRTADDVLLNTYKGEEDDLIYYKEIYSRLINRLKKGNLKRSTLLKRYSYSDKITLIHNELVYICCLTDTFRVGNYPNDILTSFKEFEEFYNTHECTSLYSKEELFRKIEQFWIDYPDGIIEFG